MDTRMFLGLEPAEWSALATALLVVTTGVYVGLTARLAKRATESAEHAKRSAVASEKAAEATRQAALIAEASLSVDFELEYNQELFEGDEHAAPQDWVVLKCTGAMVYVHSVQLEMGVVHPGGNDGFTVVLGGLEPADPPELPARIHNGESFTLRWGRQLVDLSKNNWASAQVRYSLDGEATNSRSIQRYVIFHRKA